MEWEQKIEEWIVFYLFSEAEDSEEPPSHYLNVAAGKTVVWFCVCVCVFF